MKHLLIILILLMPTMAVQAQDETTTTYSAPDIETYFSSAEMVDDCLILYSLPAFEALDQMKQLNMIRPIADQTQAARVLVHSKDAETCWLKMNDAWIPSSWSLSTLPIDKYAYVEVQRHGTDKWYFSFGGDFNADSHFSSITVGANGRIGTFLYKRVVDLSLGTTIGYSYLESAGEVSDNSEESSSVNDFNFSIDLTSRFYFTRLFSSRRLSPFVGVGVGYIISPDSAFEPQFSVGANWYLSKGSIDFAIKYGKTSRWGINIGYTIPF